MKLKDLMAKLAPLNPEAEVYVSDEVVPDDASQLVPLERVLAGHQHCPFSPGVGEVTQFPDDLEATPSDTLIVLSE